MHEVNLTEAAPAAPVERGLALRGLYEVFTSPTKLFTQLQVKPKILVPYLAIGVMSLLFFVLMADIIVQMQLDSPQLQERLQNAPNVDLEQMRPFMKMGTMGFGTLTMLVMPLIAAALALFWGNFVLAGRATFKQVLSVVLYCEVLYVFGSMILAMPLMLAKKSIAQSFSLAILAADRGVDSPVYVALSKLSVFHIWEVIVVALGCGIIFRFSKGKAYATSLLSVGLMAAIHIIWTLIASMMR